MAAETATVVEVMAEDKVTKGTRRFAATLDDPLDTPKVPSLYLPNATLKELGYKEGDKIAVTVAIAS